jgi:hypothetical protein
MALSGISDIGWYLQQSSGLIRGNTATSGASASAVGTGNTEALGQNLHVFMQALYQALSNADSTTAQTTNAGRAKVPDFGLHGRIEALIAGSNDGSLDGLQAAFNRLLQDLGAGSPGPLSALPSSPSNAFNALSVQGSDLTLHSWLQGLQQSLQRGTTRLSTIGSIIDVVV